MNGSVDAVDEGQQAREVSEQVELDELDADAVGRGGVCVAARPVSCLRGTR